MPHSARGETQCKGASRTGSARYEVRAHQGESSTGPALHWYSTRRLLSVFQPHGSCVAVVNARSATGATTTSMKLPTETENLFNTLRKSAKPEPVSAIEKLIEDAPDRELCRINALAFAARHGLDEDDVIGAFLHGARLGLFDMSWNILCPACGGILDSARRLRL